MGLRSKAIKLASSLPKGSQERKALLHALASDGFLEDLLSLPEVDPRAAATSELRQSLLEVQQLARGPKLLQFQFAPKSGKPWLKVVHSQDTVRAQDYLYQIINPKTEGLLSGDPVALYFNAESGDVSVLHPQFDKSNAKGPRYNDVGHVTQAGRKVSFQKGSWYHEDAFQDVLAKLVGQLLRQVS